MPRPTPRLLLAFALPLLVLVPPGNAQGPAPGTSLDQTIGDLYQERTRIDALRTHEVGPRLSEARRDQTRLEDPSWFSRVPFLGTLYDEHRADRLEASPSVAVPTGREALATLPPEPPPKVWSPRVEGLISRDSNSGAKYPRYRGFSSAFVPNMYGD